MANTIMISGMSGAGKSSSMKYLDPKHTFLISCTNKQPQVPGYRSKYTKLDKNNLDTANWLVSNNYTTITQILKYIHLKRPDIKYIIIDDINYLISNDIFEKALEVGYTKFSVQAKNYYDLISTCQNLREDLFVVMMSHLENFGTEVEPEYRLWTSGKMLTQQINLDGLFSYNIYAERQINDETNELEYTFRTQSNGNDTCRTVNGCFAKKYIEPNLLYVINRIKDFDETGEPEVFTEEELTVDNLPSQNKEESLATIEEPSLEDFLDS